jgi:release factor glutamine methyltransferase
LTQVSRLLKTITARLAPVSDTPQLDAQVLIAHVVGKSRSWVLAHPEAHLGAANQAKIEHAVEHLEAGMPLPYVLGNWEFYGLNFILTPDVLIPRPETELLVDRALAWLRAHPRSRRAADIGTGSGCIAVSLGVHIPDLTVCAHDISSSALRAARRNIAHYHLEERVQTLQSDVRKPLPLARSSMDMICANLPYIPGHRLRKLDVYQSEPSLALEGGQEGLDLIVPLLEHAPDVLAPGGIILLEIDARQGTRVRELAQEAFPGAAPTLEQDLAGLDRMLVVET